MMKYAVLGSGTKVTTLWRVLAVVASPHGASSFAATHCHCESVGHCAVAEVPTKSSVSHALPHVVKVTGPGTTAGAVHESTTCPPVPGFTLLHALV